MRSQAEALEDGLSSGDGESFGGGAGRAASEAGQAAMAAVGVLPDMGWRGRIYTGRRLFCSGRGGRHSRLAQGPERRHGGSNGIRMSGSGGRRAQSQADPTAGATRFGCKEASATGSNGKARDPAAGERKQSKGGR